MKQLPLKLVLLSLLVRLAFAFLPSFDVDMNVWLAWASRLSNLGPGNFYSDQVWTQYTPGFLYWLWFGGSLGWLNDFLTKIPTIIAEIITGLLIWKLLKAKNLRLANWSYLLYVLNPVVIFLGSVWGVFDGVLSLFLVLSLYYIVKGKNPVLSWFYWAIAFLIKPQAIALLPVITVASLSKFTFKQIISGLLTAGATILILSLPFFPHDPIFGLPRLIIKMGQHYGYTSLYAFNVWTMISGMWQSDSIQFLKISYSLWGTIFYILSTLLIIYLFKKQKKSHQNFFTLAATASLGFYLFPTRMHERYLFPFFAFLIIAAGIKKSSSLYKLYGITSLLYLFNLYLPYSHYTDNFIRVPALLNLSQKLAPFIALGFLLTFFYLLFLNSKIVLSKSLKKSILKTFYNLKKSKYKAIICILLIAFIVKTFRLGIPTNYHFDEVYHAFTAREMLNGNIKAWQWWNTSPEGVAYEWTHPPIAKHFMVLGMIFFGENSFGWRFPGVIFGTLNIYLVYLLAKKLFDQNKKLHKSLPLIAAAIYSLESLTFVQSRIGMNDIYMISFILISLLSLLNKKHSASALSFGLALATKWSAIYLAPVLLTAYLLKEKFVLKKCLKIGVLYLIIPVSIYLLSYLPFFVFGHSWEKFIQLQQQMYWYHTRLNATHSYSSMWWSWPLMLRPVWYYVDYGKNTIANIYALGNVFIFWPGLLTVLYSFRYIRQKSHALLLAGYFSFLLPWALSPRIMFVYHYLPSIPFMVILLAWVLSKIYLKNKYIVYYYLSFVIFYLLFFFPYLTGIHIPSSWVNIYHWLSGWK